MEGGRIRLLSKVFFFVRSHPLNGRLREAQWRWKGVLKHMLAKNKTSPPFQPACADDLFVCLLTKRVGL